jgi:protein-S-isoprenylcysteine O-methyltransferase Ste14
MIEQGTNAGSFSSRGGWWVFCQAVLMTAVLVLGLAFHATTTLFLRMLAGVLLGLAAGMGLAGAFALGKRLSPFPRPAPDVPLIQTGIYGVIRHPLYSSVMCGLWGWALLWGSVPAGGASLLAMVFFGLKARREERWLRERFPAYADYEQRVKRFIPWVY